MLNRNTMAEMLIDGFTGNLDEKAKAKTVKRAARKDAVKSTAKMVGREVVRHEVKRRLPNLPTYNGNGGNNGPSYP